jgi:hypothetical protein
MMTSLFDEICLADCKDCYEVFVPQLLEGFSSQLTAKDWG